MKVCSGCRQEKPLVEFHRERGKKDGRQGLCKPCRKAYSHTWELAHRNRKGDYNRQWFRDNPKKRAEAKSRYAERYPERAAAHKAVGRALATGQLRPPPLCEECGVGEATQLHHAFGYAPENWLRGIWLCSSCHGATRRIYNRPIFKFERPS